MHLLGPRKPREGIVVRGTKKKFKDTGRFDHIAFAAHRHRRRAQAPEVQEGEVPRADRAAHRRPQIFLYDPDGVGVELNFPPGA